MINTDIVSDIFNAKQTFDWLLQIEIESDIYVLPNIETGESWWRLRKI